MQKITPFLWFNDCAQEAALFYTAVFKNASILNERRRADTDKVMSVTICIEGAEYHLFNGGPHFSFTPAISLFVDCESQAEVDDLWERLSAGGEQLRCGWLTDKFGLSWQIIPKQLSQLLQDTDSQKAQRVMNAMMQMSKIDIHQLLLAADSHL